MGWIATISPLGCCGLVLDAVFGLGHAVAGLLADFFYQGRCGLVLIVDFSLLGSHFLGLADVVTLLGLFGAWPFLGVSCSLGFLVQGVGWVFSPLLFCCFFIAPLRGFIGSQEGCA